MWWVVGIVCWYAIAYFGLRDMINYPKEWHTDGECGLVVAFWLFSPVPPVCFIVLFTVLWRVWRNGSPYLDGALWWLFKPKEKK